MTADIPFLMQYPVFRTNSKIGSRKWNYHFFSECVENNYIVQTEDNRDKCTHTLGRTKVKAYDTKIDRSSQVITTISTSGEQYFTALDLDFWSGLCSYIEHPEEYIEFTATDLFRRLGMKSLNNHKKLYSSLNKMSSIILDMKGIRICDSKIINFRLKLLKSWQMYKRGRNNIIRATFDHKYIELHHRYAVKYDLDEFMSLNKTHVLHKNLYRFLKSLQLNDYQYTIDYAVFRKAFRQGFKTRQRAKRLLEAINDFIVDEKLSKSTKLRSVNIDFTSMKTWNQDDSQSEKMATVRLNVINEIGFKYYGYTYEKFNDLYNEEKNNKPYKRSLFRSIVSKRTTDIQYDIRYERLKYYGFGKEIILTEHIKKQLKTIHMDRESDLVTFHRFTTALIKAIDRYPTVQECIGTYRLLRTIIKGDITGYMMNWASVNNGDIIKDLMGDCSKIAMFNKFQEENMWMGTYVGIDCSYLYYRCREFSEEYEYIDDFEYIDEQIKSWDEQNHKMIRSWLKYSVKNKAIYYAKDLFLTLKRYFDDSYITDNKKSFIERRNRLKCKYLEKRKMKKMNVQNETKSLRIGLLS